MLRGMLFRRALRFLFSLDTPSTNWPMPATEADVPSTIRMDGYLTDIPDTTHGDGWRELAERQSYRAAWIRRNAMRFGAATRGEALDQVKLDLLQRRRHDLEA